MAIESIAIAVRPNLNVPGLTIEQLQGIYLGRITNWSQIGESICPLFLIQQNNQTDQQAGEAYVNLLLTDQGQQLLSSTGFVESRRTDYDDRFCCNTVDSAGKHNRLSP